jgi:hypothetical protein
VDCGKGSSAVAVSVGSIVGGLGVSVSVGLGVGVWVSVGSGVSVSVGLGVSVLVGVEVFVGLGVNVRVGVRVRVSVTVAVGVRGRVAVELPSRVRVGGRGVQVTNFLAVVVVDGVTVGELVKNSVTVGVRVGIYSERFTAVNATAVLIGLEKAESTIS